MIVINVQWLCSDVIGKLLSHDCFATRPPDGRFLLQDLQSVFSKSDMQDVAFILDALELASASHQRGEAELTIGCFVRSQAPPTDPLPTDQVCIALRLGFTAFGFRFCRATLCASAVFAVARCPSVRLSVTLVYCIQHNTIQYNIELRFTSYDL